MALYLPTFFQKNMLPLNNLHLRGNYCVVGEQIVGVKDLAGVAFEGYSGSGAAEHLAANPFREELVFENSEST